MDKRDPNLLLDETEEAFLFLKKEFPLHQNAMQSLAQAFAISLGDPIEKCERTLLFEERLKFANI